VGNLPPLDGQLTEALIIQYFTKYMEFLKFTTPSPVMDVSLNHNSKNFCFVEFRSIADADAVFHLMQGCMMGANALKLNRPKDYQGVPADLRDYIVGHPPGAFKPPPYSGTLTILPPTSASTSGQPSTASTTLSPSQASPSGTLVPESMSIEEEYQKIMGLSKSLVNDFVIKALPLLTPLSLINQPLVTEQLHLLSTSSSSLTTPKGETVIQISNMVRTSSPLEINKLSNNIEWLNLADDLVTFLHQELAKILYDTSHTTFFGDIIIPRPSSWPDQPQDHTDPIDPQTGIYLFSGAPTERLGNIPHQQHRVIGPWNPTAQKYLGSVFIVCTNQSSAETILHVLSQSLYFKQLMYAQFCPMQVVDDLLAYLDTAPPNTTMVDQDQSNVNSNLYEEQGYDETNDAF